MSILAVNILILKNRPALMRILARLDTGMTPRNETDTDTATDTGLRTDACSLAFLPRASNLQIDKCTVCQWAGTWSTVIRYSGGPGGSHMRWVWWVGTVLVVPPTRDGVWPQLAPGWPLLGVPWLCIPGSGYPWLRKVSHRTQTRSGTLVRPLRVAIHERGGSAKGFHIYS